VFNPEGDLGFIQNLMMTDATILSEMNLTSATPVEVIKHILKRSLWNDLVTGEIRMCIHLKPSQNHGMTSNISQDVLQVDVHVPALQDFMAYRIQKRVKELLHRTQNDGKIFFFNGMLGELPTLTNFICTGSRYRFFTSID
jgi:hypothetical protein